LGAVGERRVVPLLLVRGQELPRVAVGPFEGRTDEAEFGVGDPVGKAPGDDEHIIITHPRGESFRCWHRRHIPTVRPGSDIALTHASSQVTGPWVERPAVLSRPATRLAVHRPKEV